MNGAADSAASRIFGSLFGDWIFPGAAGGGLETTLSHLLSLLSVGALVFYSIIVIYIVLAGLIQASARGSAVGRWHGGWVPFRLILGALLVMPLYTGAQWGGAQLGLLSVAKTGSDFADWVAARTVMKDLLERYNNGDNFRVQPSLAAAQHFVDQSLASISCLSVRHELGNPLDLQPGSAAYDHWLKKAASLCGIPLQYVDPAQSWVPASSNRGFSVEAGLPWTASSESIKNSADEYINYLVSKHNEKWFFEIWTKYHDAIFQDHAKTGEILGELKRDVTIAYYAGLQQKLNVALPKYYKTMSELYVKDIRSRGWFYIFTQQKDLARIGQYTQSLVNARIKEMTPNVKFNNGVTTPDQLIDYTVAQRLNAVEKEDRKLFDVMTEGYPSKAIDAMKSWLSDTIGLQPLLDARDGKIDPLVALSRSGSALFNTGMAAWISGKAADLLDPLPGGLTDTITSVSLFVIVIGGLFLFISYLPVLFGASAILRWVTHVIEMLIAAPFWAAAHAAPDGESHTSRLAAKGYNNLLFIILFPALVVAGFFAAVQISNVMLPFLLDFVQVGVFEDAEKTQQFLFEPGRFVVFFTLLAVISWIVIHGSYQLIETAPAAILGWISDSAPGLNPFASRGGQAGGAVGMIFSRSARLPAPPRGRGPRPPAGRTPPPGRGPGAA